MDLVEGDKKKAEEAGDGGGKRGECGACPLGDGWPSRNPKLDSVGVLGTDIEVNRMDGMGEGRDEIRYGE